MKKAALAFISLWLVCTAFARPVSAAAMPSGGRMELFLEAMDGKGWQWFFMADTVRRRLDSAELRVYPLVAKNSDGTFSARRGEPELAEATRLAVVIKVYPGKILNYLNARSLSPAADGWRDAALFAGINPDELEKLAASDGAAALAEAYQKTSAAGVTETALFLGGKPYGGSQRIMPLYEAVNASLRPPGARLCPRVIPPGPKRRPRVSGWFFPPAWRPTTPW